MTGTAAGSAFPLVSLKTATGPPSSVRAWAMVAGRNSVTRPDTSTESPTATVGEVEPRNTKIPSLVSGSASAVGSCIQKPRELPVVRTAVTMPGTLVTDCPTIGEIRPVPWMSWMRVDPGTGSVLPPSSAMTVTRGCTTMASPSPPVGRSSTASRRPSDVTGTASVRWWMTAPCFSASIATCMSRSERRITAPQLGYSVRSGQGISNFRSPE